MISDAPDPSVVTRDLLKIAKRHPEHQAAIDDAVKLIGRTSAFVFDNYRALLETGLVETIK